MSLNANLNSLFGKVHQLNIDKVTNLTERLLAISSARITNFQEFFSSLVSLSAKSSSDTFCN